MENDFFKTISGKICPYCNCETRLQSGESIYPHLINQTPRPAFLDKQFYVCNNNIDHYVGTYADNIKSFGRLADYELRKLKNKGHKCFDPLWKETAIFNSQSEAYRWLSEKMNLPIEYTHFGMFSNEQCIKAINFCEEKINSK